MKKAKKKEAVKKTVMMTEYYGSSTHAPNTSEQFSGTEEECKNFMKEETGRLLNLFGFIKPGPAAEFWLKEYYDAKKPERHYHRLYKVV